MKAFIWFYDDQSLFSSSERAMLGRARDRRLCTLEIDRQLHDSKIDSVAREHAKHNSAPAYTTLGPGDSHVTSKHYVWLTGHPTSNKDKWEWFQRAVKIFILPDKHTGSGSWMNPYVAAACADGYDSDRTILVTDQPAPRKRSEEQIDDRDSNYYEALDLAELNKLTGPARAKYVCEFMGWNYVQPSYQADMSLAEVEFMTDVPAWVYDALPSYRLDRERFLVFYKSGWLQNERDGSMTLLGHISELS